LTKTTSPVNELVKQLSDAIPPDIKKKTRKVVRATLRGAIEAGSAELIKIIDGGETSAKKKRNKKKEEWGT
jgi:hypothetical protein